jgi:hypothetical protein
VFLSAAVFYVDAGNADYGGQVLLCKGITRKPAEKGLAG